MKSSLIQCPDGGGALGGATVGLYQNGGYDEKLHYVFDTDSGGVKRGLVFWARRARSSPPVKSGMDPAIFMQ